MQSRQTRSTVRLLTGGITKIVKGECRIANLFANYAEPHPIFDGSQSSQRREQRQMKTKFSGWLCRTASYLRRQSKIQPLMPPLLLSYHIKKSTPNKLLNGGALVLFIVYATCCLFCRYFNCAFFKAFGCRFEFYRSRLLR